VANDLSAPCLFAADDGLDVLGFHASRSAISVPTAQVFGSLLGCAACVGDGIEQSQGALYDR
jgi:hypothetical protein